MLIAIDIGNTNILIGTIGVNGDIHDQHRISTNDFIVMSYMTLYLCVQQK